MATEVPIQPDSQQSSAGVAIASPPSVEHAEAPSLRSRLPGRIGELSILRRSLLFAELSDVAYYDEDFVVRLVEPLNLHLTMEFFDRDGAQAYRLENDHDSVIVCRGTEPGETNDVKADIRCREGRGQGSATCIAASTGKSTICGR